MPKQFMTVVIELPDDRGQQRAIRDALPIFRDFHGGAAMYAGDALAENGLFARETGEAVAENIRRVVNES